MIKEVPVEDFMPQIEADMSALSAFNLGHSKAQEDSREELEKAWLEIARLESQVLRSSKREQGLHECCIDLIDLLPAFRRLPGLDRYKQEFSINSGGQA